MTLTANPEGQCKVCDRAFLRFRTTQAVCGPSCARKSVKADKKREAAETRAKRTALMSRGDWLKAAQVAFNTWTRFRDSHLPCISCGKATGSHWDAGHYLTVGARPELRFTPDNCHKQCIRCNQHLHGNVAMYRIGLVGRIGLARVEALEGPHPPAKWSVDEMRTIRDAYRALAKSLREGRTDMSVPSPADPPPAPESTDETESFALHHPKPASCAPGESEPPH